MITGPPVASFNVTVLNVSAAFVQWEPQPTTESLELTVQAVGSPGISEKEIVLCGEFRNQTIVNLAAGKQYQFTIKPIYEVSISGNAVSAIVTMAESSKK